MYFYKMFLCNKVIIFQLFIVFPLCRGHDLLRTNRERKKDDCF
ncbi:hypothetical protein DN38_3350 [Vibrio cholerae]|nr:hypothetical protein DN38_3350 [Vibrio cholerae]